MIFEPLQDLAALGAGVMIGFMLGLVGGGGSILAVPLLTYLVRVPAPHVAIGTSAVAVACNAAVNLIIHARKGAVQWRCALIFAPAGVVGAFAGSTLGKAFDGQKLLFMFALIMFVVGGLMVRGRRDTGRGQAECGAQNAAKIVSFGASAGLLSGFFGIGGGFLIVPALMTSTGMAMRQAVASSLVAVTAFGLAAATNYALSGLVDWRLALVLVAGGALGGLLGAAASDRLAGQGRALNWVFASLICCVATYMLWRSGLSILGR